MPIADFVSDPISFAVIRIHHRQPRIPLFMRGLIEDNLPTLFTLFGLVVLLGVLCVCAFASMQASTLRRRFWFSLAPIGFGLTGVWAQIPFTMELGGFHWHFDFGWLFLIPLLLGVAGFISYWRARHEHVA